MTYLFTSESVSEGHPDKVADAISDTVVDYFMEQGSDAVRCACEAMVTTNRVIIAGEYKGEFDENVVERRIRECVRAIGYDQDGFDHARLEFANHMHGQSADIALGTDSFGAGDQGLMFGHACRETDTLMPAAIYWSHRIVETLAELRHTGRMPWLGPDAKSQVTMEYDDCGRPLRVAKIVCSTQHSASMAIADVRRAVQDIITPLFPELWIDAGTEFYINPTGRFVIGGPDGDCGITGRKIIVDTYGGYAPHGGGAFSGKDPTKVDRSAAYMMRYVAKNIVAAGYADRATCQVSYAIGVEQPMSFRIDVGDEAQNHGLTESVTARVDLRPRAIIERFDLFRPIYHRTVNYGHFGRADLPWEQIDLF
jgi:S-adenosylmethionine synthetase